MMERLTTITAAEWYKVAEHVEAGRCEVWDNDMPEPAQIDDVYYYTTPTEIVYQMHYADVDDMSDTVKCSQHRVFEVRWLDTAQTERDKAAYELFAEGYQAAEAGDAPSVNVIAAYVGELEATVASLQAERDELASNLAAARSHLQAIVDYVSAPDKVSAKDMSEFDVILGMWSQATAGLSANPQPAPAPTSELVAAVKQVIENESDGCGNCRYCNAEEVPFRNGVQISWGDINEELGEPDEYRILKHKTWCPSVVLAVALKGGEGERWSN